MYVSQLLDMLFLCPNIEVVISWLPEWVLSAPSTQFSRDDLFQHLQGHSQIPALRLADK